MRLMLMSVRCIRRVNEYESSSAEWVAERVGAIHVWLCCYSSLRQLSFLLCIVSEPLRTPQFRYPSILHFTPFPTGDRGIGDLSVTDASIPRALAYVTRGTATCCVFSSSLMSPGEQSPVVCLSLPVFTCV